MPIKILTRAFLKTIDGWINQLDIYSLEQLCRKPSGTNWSVGQVYMHLIDSSAYFIDQAAICLSTDKNVEKEMKPGAKIMFKNNEFPDEIIEGPSSNAHTSQPQSKQEILDGLMNVKEKLKNVEMLASESNLNGKTRHEGLEYFNAAEWLQFAEMHFRHHLRQKKRIEDYFTFLANR